MRAPFVVIPYWAGADELVQRAWRQGGTHGGRTIACVPEENGAGVRRTRARTHREVRLCLLACEMDVALTRSYCRGDLQVALDFYRKAEKYVPDNAKLKER